MISTDQLMERGRSTLQQIILSLQKVTQSDILFTNFDGKSCDPALLPAPRFLIEYRDPEFPKGRRNRIAGDMVPRLLLLFPLNWTCFESSTMSDHLILVRGQIRTVGERMLQFQRPKENLLENTP